jgi:hypothetical protein
LRLRHRPLGRVNPLNPVSPYWCIQQYFRNIPVCGVEETIRFHLRPDPALRDFLMESFDRFQLAGLALICLPAQTTIPNHKELDRGTLRAIIRQTGLTVEEFIALL